MVAGAVRRGNGVRAQVSAAAGEVTLRGQRRAGQGGAGRARSACGGVAHGPVASPRACARRRGGAGAARARRVWYARMREPQAGAGRVGWAGGVAASGVHRSEAGGRGTGLLRGAGEEKGRARPACTTGKERGKGKKKKKRKRKWKGEMEEEKEREREGSAPGSRR